MLCCTRLTRTLSWSFVAASWLFAAGCGLFLPDDEASRVLQDLAVMEGDSVLKRHTPAPRRKTLSIDQDGLEADIYLPGDNVQAGLLLVPGLAREGKADPRLVAFATTLARVGFLMLVPDLPNLRALKVRAADSRLLVKAFIRMRQLTDSHDTLPLGIGAFSFAAGPALLAALDATIHDRVDFVITVGGYHDLAQVITFSTTGYYHNDGWHYLAPNPYGKWAFVLSNADLLSSAHDRQLLTRLAERKLLDPESVIDDATLQPGPEGRALLALLDNRDPDRVPALIAALPAPIRQQIDALNLAAQDLSRLQARLLLLHGTDDPIIPPGESLALQATLAPEQAELFLIEGLTHVDLQPSSLDRRAAWRAIDALLALRAPSR